MGSGHLAFARVKSVQSRINERGYTTAAGRSDFGKNTDDYDVNNADDDMTRFEELVNLDFGQCFGLFGGSMDLHN